MNITQIEEVVKKLASEITANKVNHDEFIYQLMAAYGHRKTTIGRIKSGERNLAKVQGEVRAKRHIYFKQSQSNCVLSDIDNMKKEPSVARDKIRFVIATDFSQFVALDTRTHDTLDIEFTELGKHFDFFLPWAGMEKAVYQGENPADVKAAEKMAKLFDLIKADNFDDENKDDTTALHNLNVFLTRLLFCFFAEDTGIFTRNQFSENLESKTKADGSDVDGYLNRLFEVLNTNKEDRGELPDYLAQYEYVNGGLFANTIASPSFSTKSRKMLIECGSELDWSDINPDIFGSMIQAVVHPDQRGGMGMHYTSVTNIMKVIEPLFLDELYAEFENIEDNIDAKLKPSRLRKLHERIAEIKIFDPACGSGNFLIIAFKELRKLEMEIIKRLQELDQNDNQDDLFGDVGLDSSFSRIKLSQFYGIELDDFAHEVAILSLWLAEHQMNVEFKAEFGECEPSLPLRSGGQIINGNAVRMNWEDICSPSGGQGVYILGNPPYLGARMQSVEQKKELSLTFSGNKNYKNLDYIACWFLKAANYIKGNLAEAAFVSTNSICQGEQVEMLWPLILNDLKIKFAYTSFPWSNNAKSKAAVICVIIGLKNKAEDKASIYTNHLKLKVSNINGYLIPARNIFIGRKNKPISNIPPMPKGNMPYDGGNLLLDKNEKDELITNYPDAQKYIKKIVGAKEFIQGIERYCLWIENGSLSSAMQIKPIFERVENTKAMRLSSSDKAANKLANRPHQFREVNVTTSNSLVIPSATSERREYIPIGFVDSNTIVSNLAFVVYDVEPYLLSILTSKMHMAWVKTVSGRLKSDYRYSSALSYNTFPIPDLDTSQKSLLTELSIELLAKREEFIQPLSTLYDPDKMPQELRAIHDQIDVTVDKIYTNQPMDFLEERLEVLFNLYEKMTGGQNA